MQIGSDTVIEKMIQFAKEYHNEHKTAPTVVNVVEAIPEIRNVTHFYHYMPGGIPELCRRANIPVDYERLIQTARATAARKGKSGGGNQTERGRGPELVLSEELSRRIYGASYLAGISDPFEIIARMLDLDADLRLNNHSSKDMKIVSSFLKEAKKRRWKSSGELSIINGITRFQNSGLLSLDAPHVQKLATLIEVMEHHGVGVEELGKDLAELSRLIDIFQDFRTGMISGDQAKGAFRS